MKIRRITIDGDVARVPLTRGFMAIIDTADVPLVEGFNWYADEKSGTVYAATTVLLDNGNQCTLYLHRRVLGLTISTVHVDHIDGNGLNNQRSNIRPCSRSENMRNRGAYRNNTSGFKGVFWFARDRRWRARIRVDGKDKHLGFFDDPEAAHEAYCAAAAELHGEFARVA
jgi:hypothetical protein